MENELEYLNKENQHINIGFFIILVIYILTMTLVLLDKYYNSGWNNYLLLHFIILLIISCFLIFYKCNIKSKISKISKISTEIGIAPNFDMISSTFQFTDDLKKINDNFIPSCNTVNINDTIEQLKKQYIKINELLIKYKFK
jgi:hypothetical protein